MSRIGTTLQRQLARRGFVVQRHPAARRQKMLAAYGVDAVLDVGAARGSYARELRGFGYRGRIVSFEPLAAAYADLLAASATDPAWTAVNAALGATAGRRPINVASNSDSSSLLAIGREHLAAAPHVTYVAQEEIEVSRLDDVAPDLLPADCTPFLKLDTQGFEREVLRGGPDTLGRCVGLQVELSFVSLYDDGIVADEAISLAYAQGFHLVGLEQGFTSPRGQLLQADGVFFRGEPDRPTTGDAR